ncbi:GntR family transcriptional regulator [Daeguia caeni]|uniref:GntR family transcriptional regulator n=1 Tax=Daeguia caeni TaxID=439612 RepID=A0ABV9H2G6_9HYPH
MDFVQLTSEPLHEQAYNALRNALRMGRFMPGQTMTTRGLGASLGISATPVREALQRLIAEGALELLPNRSIRVPEMTRARFSEITEIRCRLEPLAASSAVNAVSESLLQQLVNLRVSMHVAITEGRFSDYLADNQSFHFAIYAAAGMPYLLQLIGLCWLQTGPWLNMLAHEGRFHAIANDEHDVMIAALRNKDVEALAAAVEKDIREASQVLMLHLPQ